MLVVAQSVNCQLNSSLIVWLLLFVRYVACSEMKWRILISGLPMNERFPWKYGPNRECTLTCGPKREWTSSAHLGRRKRFPEGPCGSARCLIDWGEATTSVVYIGQCIVLGMVTVLSHIIYILLICKRRQRICHSCMVTTRTNSTYLNIWILLAPNGRHGIFVFIAVISACTPSLVLISWTPCLPMVLLPLAEYCCEFSLNSLNISMTSSPIFFSRFHYKLNQQ